METLLEIYLWEVAEVKDAFKDIRDKVRASGKACVGMQIQRRADGNTVAIDKAVNKQIEELRKVLPDDYKITVQDEQASWIVGALDNVFGNMRIGILLTAIALFVFLHSLRGTLIVALTMPISVVATFIIMYLTGFTLNLMSMMGLAMTIGILVDNSVLVLENITRHLHMDMPPKEAAVKGTIDIASRKQCHSVEPGRDLHWYVSRMADKLPTVFTLIDGIYSSERGPSFDGKIRRNNILIAEDTLMIKGFHQLCFKNKFKLNYRLFEKQSL